jgi:uncharacterized protein YutE (UPF0331/DUF86 family)
MVDVDLVMAKAARVRAHLKRVRKKCGDDAEAFLKDRDRQDIVAFNMHTAIQNCVDMAAHIVSEEDLGVPGSVNEMFYMLQEEGVITEETTEKMVKAVGFRNLLVHEYGKIDLRRVYRIAREDIGDLMAFISEILKSLRMDP